MIFYKKHHLLDCFVKLRSEQLVGPGITKVYAQIFVSSSLLMKVMDINIL